MKGLCSLTILAFALMCFITQTASACDCMFGGGAPCEDFWKAKAVFVGTVIESRQVTRTQQKNEWPRLAVRFSIDEAFRGVDGPEVEVLTGLGGGDCGFNFQQTQQYLVYAYEHQGRLTTSICTRTKSISKATEDLSYARGVATAKSGGRLDIKVLRHRKSAEGSVFRIQFQSI